VSGQGKLTIVLSKVQGLIDVLTFLKVLDEIFLVLRRIATEHNLPRSHEVLKELRDISSMAIEHFDEVIAPLFKNKDIAIAGGYSSEFLTVTLPDFPHGL
jgi:hypothetical protein